MVALLATTTACLSFPTPIQMSPFFVLTPDNALKFYDVNLAWKFLEARVLMHKVPIKLSELISVDDPELEDQFTEEEDDSKQPVNGIENDAGPPHARCTESQLATQPDYGIEKDASSPHESSDEEVPEWGKCYAAG